MLTAAELWAFARRQGKPTADHKALDADVILVAQALLIRQQGRETVIATTNVAHLEQFVSAYLHHSGFVTAGSLFASSVSE